MSAMIISSIKKFIEMSEWLEELGFRNLHFYNSRNGEGFNAPIITLLPFIDLVILSNDEVFSADLAKIIDEAVSRNIPVLFDDCLHKIKNFSY